MAGRGRLTNRQRALQQQQRDQQNLAAQQRLQAQQNQVIPPNNIQVNQQINMQEANPAVRPNAHEKRRRPLFDGTNWTSFKFSVRIDLRDEEVYNVTTGQTPRPAGEGADAIEWERKNNRALRILNDCFNESVRGLVKHLDTAAEVWTALVQMYETRNASNKHTIQQKFYNFSYNESQTARENVSRLNSLVADCLSVGIVLDREGIVTKMLFSLPKSCDALVYAFRGKPDADRTLEELANMLADKDMMDEAHARRTEPESRPPAVERKEVQAALVHRTNAQAGHAQSQQRQQRQQRPNSNQSDRPNNNNNFGRNRNNFQQNNRFQNDRQSSGNGGRFNGRCNICNKRGHRSTDCWYNRDNQQSNQFNNSNRQPPQHQNFQQGNNLNRPPAINNNFPNQASGYYAGQVQHNDGYAPDYDNLPHRVSNLHMSCTGSADTDDGWIGDSGAGKHMTPKFELFTTYKRLPPGRMEVELGNKQVVPVVGIGSIDIISKQGHPHTLLDVLHVPDIGFNLFSLREVTRKGCTVNMVGNDVFVYRGSELLLTGTANSDQNYTMNFDVKSTTTACAARPRGASIDVWHQRLGHTNYVTVRRMIDDGQVNGLVCNNLNPPEACEACILAKMTRKPFKQSLERAQQPGELIHFDMAGPFEVKSIGRATYLLLFVDDLSGMTFVYALKNKSDVTFVFQELLALVRAHGHQIKRVRSDNALEFTSDAMNKLLTVNGILHEFSAPYCPEQNGRAERQNRTIIEMVNTLKTDARLPNFLWAELANASAYIRNFIPLERLNGRTPYETWFGRRPDVSHLKVIGSRAFAHVSHSRKLENRAEELVLVGYEWGSHSYRLWNPQTNVVKVSPSVKFIEPHVEVRTPIEIRQTVNRRANTNTTAQQTVNSEASERVAIHTRSKGPILPSITNANLASSNELLITPQTFEEAIQSPQSNEWRAAMKDEIASLYKNGTWNLVQPSECTKSPLRSKWVFKTKLDQHGNIDRFKARLCVKGCSQKAGIDYNETFAPVARYETIRTLLAVAANRNLILRQFDIATAFLNGELEEEIFMHQPEGFGDGTSRVCRLNKSLYGLKQAPRAWNSTFDRFLQSFGLVKSANDPCLYTNQTLFLVLYVDDGLIAAQSGGEVDDLIKAMERQFDVKTTNAQYYLGMQIEQNHQQNSIKIHQQAYINSVLAKFNMADCHPTATPAEPGGVLKANQGEKANIPYRQIIGSLMHLTVSTRPDIAFIVSKLSQYLDNPSNDHWRAVKRILAYLKGTSEVGILYDGRNSDILKVYTDADFAMCADTRKSTSGVVITLFNSPILWFSRKQGIVTDSTTYAEYVAAHDGAREIVWMRRILRDFGCDQINPTPLFCDNEAASSLIVNSQFHHRSKHIDTHFHYVRDVFKNGHIKIISIPTKKQLADLFTKPLAQYDFNNFKHSLNIC